MRVYSPAPATLFSEREVHVRYMLSPVRLSVVCNVHAPYTQAIEIVGNISMPFNTLAIY